MTGLVRRSSFAYGETIWTAALSAAPWKPTDSPLGITRWTATGIPGPVLTRRDSLVVLPLRILESEWAAFMLFLDYAQSQRPVLWSPDAEVDDAISVYLEHPALGEDWAPTQDTEFPRIFRVELTLRGEGPLVPWLGYFED